MDRFQLLRQSASADATTGFAGVYMDNAAGGIVVVLATMDTPALRTAISNALLGARHEVRIVRNTMADLKTAEDTILQRWRSGDSLGGVHVVTEAIDVRRNRLVVTVDATQSVKDFRESFYSATGLDPDVVDISAGPSTRSTVSRYSTASALFGGARIFRSAGGGAYSSCSNTGSSYINGVNYWLVTAGHCGESTAWKQGTTSNPNSIGPSTGHSNGFFDYSESYCDCQVIGPIYGKQTNKVLDAANNPQNVFYMAGPLVFEVGRNICYSGATRNSTRCGLIENASANTVITENGHTTLLMDQIITSVDVCKGDSGGSWTYATSTWVGIQSGGGGNTYQATFSGSDTNPATCYQTSTLSKLTSSNLYWYLGMDGMMTWQ